MNKTDISAKQMEATIALFLIGSSLVSSGSSSVKQNTWFCVLTGMVLAIPMVWVNSRILELYPGQDYFQNIFRATGRPAGTVICALMTFYILHLGTLVLRNFAEFIHIVNMTETPIIAILVSLTAVLVYALSNRLYVLARLSKFVLPFLLAFVVITVVLSYNDMDWNNLRPVLHCKPAEMANGILAGFTLPYGEVVVCASMFGSLERNAKIFPTFLKGVLLAFLVLIVADLRNTLVIGYVTGVFEFPSYEAVSVITLGEFFTRIEVLIGINLLLAGFVKTGVLLYSSCEGLSKVFQYKDYEPLVAPVSLLILTASVLVHRNTAEMDIWVRYLPFYSLPFQVLLPVLVLIVGTIRKKIETTKKQGKECASPKPQET
jgi:spore germination protein KB